MCNVPGAIGHNNPEDHAAGQDERPTVLIVRSRIRNLDDSAAGDNDRGGEITVTVEGFMAAPHSTAMTRK
jgi:hypothetical protein